MTIVISICIFASILVCAMAFGLGYAVGFSTEESKPKQIGKYINRDFDKVTSVIRSCKNGKQIDVARKMANRFVKLYPDYHEYRNELDRLLKLQYNSCLK